MLQLGEVRWKVGLKLNAFNSDFYLQSLKNFNCGLKDIDQTSDDGEFVLNPDIYTEKYIHNTTIMRSPDHFHIHLNSELYVNICPNTLSLAIWHFSFWENPVTAADCSDQFFKQKNSAILGN